MLAGTAAILQINVDDNPSLSARFAVSGIPVVHLLQKGKTVDQMAGAQTAEALVGWFRGRQSG